jgi:ubiquinone/menaquinone biosynthesis C-methylase UbiE
MEGHHHLRIWDDSAVTIIPHAAEESGSGLAGPHDPAEFAERLFAHEALSGQTSQPPCAEPYSLQWFLNIESQRHGQRQGRWIPRLLEFAKHSGERLLGLGDGLGTDWLQYARHGADVVVCSASVEQLSLIRRNFELRGLGGRFLHAAATALPLEPESIDVACISGLLAEVPDPSAVVREVYRVLKPGGKVLAVIPARYDIDFWFHLVFPWHSWLNRSSRAPEVAPVRYTSRRLHRLFAEFTEHRVHKRQLRRSEVPRIWRWLPMPLLERLGGRMLVVKAFKPLSAAEQLPLAA